MNSWYYSSREGPGTQTIPAIHPNIDVQGPRAHTASRRNNPPPNSGHVLSSYLEIVPEI